MNDPQQEVKPLAEMSDKEFSDYLFSLTYQNVREAYPAAINEAVFRITDRATTISHLQKLIQPHVQLGVER